MSFFIVLRLQDNRMTEPIERQCTTFFINLHYVVFDWVQATNRVKENEEGLKIIALFCHFVN
jgi:hypothetical protein